MIVKNNNEITVKAICSKEKLISVLIKKGFTSGRTFTLDDYYFIPKELDIKNLDTREIISKCIIIRDIFDNNIHSKEITYKIKEFNDNGDILSQKAINCDIYDIEQAKLLLESVGYKQIMNIKEDDIIYLKDGLELAIKDIKNGDILIEVETEPNSDFDTINKLKNVITNLEIPIVANEFFVKKAEIELNKILNR
jgi:predicted adenylyl cyclase CyaB